MVASVGLPSALASTPDGRVLIANKSGRLRVYQDGRTGTTLALDISGRICANSERGLLGVAVDPNFSTNKYIYLFYTHNKHGACPTFDPSDPTNPVNRVSRFVMSGDNVDAASEKILIDNMPSIGRHNAGDLHFGKDDYLYVSVGDGGCDYMGDSGCAGENDASRDTHVLLGKILRITRDGKIPPDNPYQGNDSARCNLAGKTDPGKNCQETFAQGLRNPFRFAFDPDASGTRFFIGDVGGDAWEEVDLGQAGADYAWNLCEGNHDNPFRSGSVDCTAAPYTPPIHEYSHADTGCKSITGQAFVPNDGGWPASYDGSYLFGDYVCNKIFELKPKEGGGFVASEFATGMGQSGPIAMAFVPHGTGKALYYTTYANNGELHRIAYTASNHAPDAAVSASPTYGEVPLDVGFDGGASSDPDADALTYTWDFGDGSPTAETTTPTTSHTYTEANKYTATLTVRDSSGAEDTATASIDAGNTPPEPTIELPIPEKLFEVGETIVLQGSATDPQEGQLADGSLSWEVRQHHNGDHWHPHFSGTGNNLGFTAPPPENLSATGPGNYLEIRLTATDSTGLSKTITQELQPNRVDMAFESQPTGLSLQVNGETFAAPRTVVSWEGYNLNAHAPSPQTLAGVSYDFASWSDGGAQTHDILTGTQPGTYAATYTATDTTECTITGTTASETLTGTSGDDVICGGGGNDAIKGGGGNDTLKGEGGSDQLYGGAGDDALDGGISTDFANFSGAPSAITASLATNTATGDGSDTLVDIEKISGSKYKDTLTGSDTTSDVLRGAGGNDALNGLDGNDMLKGDGGSDQLYGGAGDDALDGGTGTSNDFANFSGAPSAITASLATNTATGDGSDTLVDVESLQGSQYSDALTGSDVNNTLNGGNGDDALDGLDGADKLVGGSNSDTEHGGLGNDSVVGSGGPDDLFGEEGDDTVDSKDGVSDNDSLDGGTHLNGDTAITDATEKSIVGFP